MAMVREQLAKKMLGEVQLNRLERAKTLEEQPMMLGARLKNQLRREKTLEEHLLILVVQQW